MKKGKLDRSAFKLYVKRLPPRLWRALTANFGLKLLSVIFALFLWSYVITSSPSITREKTLSGVDVTVSGQSVLSSRGLSVLTNVADIPDARIRVKVSQASYAQVTGDNVRVELDLSGVRTTGKQSIRLRGTSTYGSVVEIWPEYVDLDIENQDQRYVPVNVEVVGAADPSLWYSINRTNPSQITVTGPTSIVQTVSSALVQLDVTGKSESHSRVEKFMLMDAQNRAISSALLSRSTNSVTIGVDIYPMREYAIEQGIGELIAGQVPDGYQVTGVTVAPTSVKVAADESLLDAMSELTVTPVDVTDRVQTFTANARVNAFKGVRHLSSEEVAVTVEIAQRQMTKRFANVQLETLNLAPGLAAHYAGARVDVRVAGPYSRVKALQRNDLQAVLNLSGKGVGAHEVPVDLSAESYPELEISANPATVTVIVTKADLAAN